MNIHPIHDDAGHASATARIETLWGAGAGTAEAEELEVLVTLVDHYEAHHHAIAPPNPIEAIRFRMEQLGLTRSDLAPMLGSRARVSEVLARKRPLTLAMIRRMRTELGLSADVLTGLDESDAAA
jgi:HTH-type transcriptional regulator/antitoxin HigA